MWGYVILAYGIVWGAIFLYTLSLKRRYQMAQDELQRLSDFKESSHHEKA